ncbi:MAG: hypothetical protein ACRBF0_10010 [Calditrichia bacterium]
MAIPTSNAINALRETAIRLSGGAEYKWTHMGSCNCGHLVQTITSLPKSKIHAYALEKEGAWKEKSIDYCPQSGYPIDHIIGAILELGFTTDDIRHLERLSSARILKRIGKEHRPLNYKSREHVILYLNAWADFLEEQLPPAADPVLQQNPIVPIPEAELV